MISSPAASNDATIASTYLKDWLKEGYPVVHRILLKMKEPDTQCGNFMILREINFWDSGSAKFAISTHLKALNLDFWDFLRFFRAGIY